MENYEKLNVKNVFLHSDTNSELHHTDRYDVMRQNYPKMMLRRGQEFLITIIFYDRNYDPDIDILELNFTFGKYSKPHKGTEGLAIVSYENEYDINEWHAQFVGQDITHQTSIDIKVKSPANIPVGQWTLYVRSKLKEDYMAKYFLYQHLIPIYFLFNPWVEEDQVYMRDENLRIEYVLNDIGKIWNESYEVPSSMVWIFGQFDAVVLDAIELMFERVNIRPANRGNPISVTRAISQIVNYENADGGVIVGNWDGPFYDGVHPCSWTESVSILKEYVQTKQPVKYGQCWVFAAVVNTVCRALGIPSRVVTNFGSAHDTDASLTIDIYHDMYGRIEVVNPITGEISDSIWNFHVWNEVWMTRPDLPEGYGGWQAIDATPQEESNGLSQCGPASVEAIRRGKVGFNYDVAFVLASVNGDAYHWHQEPYDNVYTLYNINKTEVGRKILTKKPLVFGHVGNEDMEDITHLYKNREENYYYGQQGEMTLLNAVRTINNATSFSNGTSFSNPTSFSNAISFNSMPEKSSEEFEFELLDLDEVKLGETFSVTVRIYSKSEEERIVNVSLSATSIYYTGTKAKEIKMTTEEFKIPSMDTKELRLTVQPEEYMGKLGENRNIKIYAIARVLETKQTWSQETNVHMLKPKLDMKVIGTPSAGTPCTVRFSFQNPLKTKLSGCKFLYEGPRLVNNTSNDFRDILPEEEVEVEYNFTPQRAGNFILVGRFVAKKLVNITSSIDIEVLKNEN